MPESADNPAHGPITSPLEGVAALLERHGVEYIVIGGMAAILHGALRPTWDVDLCYRRTPENIARLAAALAEIRPRLRGGPPGLPFVADARTLSNGANFTLDTDLGPLDLLGHVEPLGDYEKVAPLAESMPFGPRKIKAISIDGLIRIKQHVKRDKDLASLSELLALKRTRAE